MAGKPGNPNWTRGGASPNPSGAPKVNNLFRERCRKAVDEYVIDAWIDEVKMRGPFWMQASERLAAYGYDKPANAREDRESATQALNIIIESLRGTTDADDE